MVEELLLNLRLIRIVPATYSMTSNQASRRSQLPAKNSSTLYVTTQPGKKLSSTKMTWQCKLTQAEVNLPIADKSTHNQGKLMSHLRTLTQLHPIQTLLLITHQVQPRL